MLIATFIPALNARLLAQLHNSHAAVSFVSRDYSGEISSQGD